MLKKLLQFSGLIFLLTFTTGIANAATVKVEQDNIRYTVDTSSGTAEVYGLVSSNITITDLVIPDYIEYNGTRYTITSIRENAFLSCSALEKIGLPSSVITIGESAFDNCVSLETVDLPHALKTIGRYAFGSCKKLKKIVLPESLISIKSGAFFGCEVLTSVDIPASVTEIGYDAFACFGDANNFKSINVSKENPVYASLNGLLLSKDLTTLIEVPCGLTSVEIPNSVRTISDSAFGCCYGLTTLKIPDFITKIDVLAFHDCINLTEIEIPNSVTSIGGGAFSGCKHLTSVELPNTISSIGMQTFYGCVSLPEIKIPDSVTSIGESAFVSCLALKEIVIPDNVNLIESGAFLNCINVSKVEIGKSVRSIGNQVFSGLNKLTEVVSYNPVPPSIVDGTFTGNAYSAATLKVPKESVYSYKVANGWKKFGTIEPITVNPAEISLEIAKTTLYIGEQATIKATVLPDNTTDKTITWKSDNGAIATVAADGTVTAVAVGVATITATCGEVSASCKITVNPVVASGVTINTQDLTLLVGQSDKLTATVLPENTTNKTITWKSSDETIAKVSEDGTVSAVSVGIATITATCGEVSATCKVTVNPVVASGITINAADMTLLVGQSDKLTATILPENTTNKTITWKSSDETIAKVSEDGTVTAISVGVATITATCGEVSATCKITVNPVVASGVTINAADMTLLVGQTDKLTATILPDNTTDKTVTWTSANPEIATVGEDGTVTAISVGVVTITATCGEVSATCKVTVNPVVASGITINATDRTLLVGQSDKLTATILPENTTDKKITWTSDNPGIVTVNEDGTVTAISVGVATITATCGEVSATCKVTVNPVVASGITINAADMTLLVGQTDKLTANILPENTTNKTITWKSSDETIAKVSEDGIVTAISVGVATITATCGDVSATCKVTVNPVVASGITINAADMTLLVGQTDKLTATILPDNTTDKTITWKSSDETIAKVSEDGIVTAVSVGVATITATCGDVSATCKVTVNPVVASGITINATDMTLLVGQTDKLTATILPENTTDKTITWKSSDEAIAKVSEDGTVTAVSVGVATITATCGEVSATCKVTVNPVAASGITIDVADKTLLVGQTDKLTATILPENTTDKTITWKSSDETIAKVSEDGTVTAISVGIATITATCGEVSATCKVTVNPVVASGITINAADLTLLVGQTDKLMATILPENTTDKTITWKSSDETIAKVSEDGTVTAISVGVATITATCGEVSATCKVTVNPVVASGITINAADKTLLVGQSDKLTATILPENTTNKTITWKSSDETIAKVSEDGTVTAISVGVATITATCGEVSATCKVTVNPVVASGVTINTQDLTLLVGQSDKLTTTVLPENTTNKTITWQSSDETIAKVSEDGTVTAVSVGVATITATCGDVSATCKVTVNPVVASGITINAADMTLLVGQTDKLTATILPENTTDKTITWKSSDETIAKVSEDGTVTAVSVGVATITATCGEVSATCKVTVNPVVASSVTINTQDLTLLVGQTDKLTATILPENTTNKTITWKSSDETIAKVSEDGTVTAISVGVATITATCGEVSATCKVTVNPVVASGVTINAADMTLLVGQSDKLTATILPENTTDKKIAWKSSDETIAKVSEDGMVTAVSVGVATITATCGEVSATCKVTVNPVVASGVTINTQDLTLLVGQSDKLTATILPENTTNKTITWTSNNPEIATVGEDGTVTAISVGVATITATCGEVSATCKVTVNPVVASGITINAADMTLLVGQSDKLTATILPENTTDKKITWKSSDETIAKVSEDGIVTAVSVGVATITATCGDVSATCKVTVNPVVASGITINATDVTLLVGQSDKLTATILPENTTDKTITWKSSDETIAKVSEDGTVTAVSVGIATITATCGEVSATCKVTVNPVVASGITINAADMTLLVGQTDKLTATILPENTTDKTITWKSNDETIAKVSEDGTVTAVSVGVATITATCGEVSTTCKVTVNPVVASGVTINTQDMTLLVGQTDTLTATILPDNTTDKTVTWKSANPEIATVGEDGTVTAVSVGVATITATCGEVSATCKVTVNPVVASGITINAADMTLLVGQSDKLTATILPENTTDKTITWKSSDETIAKVSEDGTVTAVSVGVATITATCGEVSTTCKVTVNPVVASGVTINTQDMTLLVGQSDKLTATILPENTTNKTITWKSSDETIAKVSEDGTVTAISVGVVTITATCGEVSATCKVTVNPVVASGVTINTQDMTLLVGQTDKLTATILPENTTDKTIIWTSNNPEIATVGEDGTVTAISVGVATITATCGDVSATCKVTVNPVVASGITINATDKTLLVGQTDKLTATILPENTTDKTITWKSSDETIAKVSEDGTVTAVSVGIATITATCGEVSAICKVTVNPVVASGITINAADMTLLVGQTDKLTATILPENTTDKTITWKSSDETIAKVSEDGTVTAVAIGSATITATCGDVSATCKVTVKVEFPITSLVLEPSEISMAQNALPVTIKAVYSPENASMPEFEWISSDASIATVDANGTVTPVAQGEAVITCRALDGSGLSATSHVTVTAPIDENFGFDESVMGGMEGLTIYLGESVTISPVAHEGYVLPANIAWRSSKESIATVDQTGKVTGVGLGSSTITASATINGKVVEATCWVNVIPVKVSSIELSATTAELRVTETLKLTTAILPENATDKTLQWTTNAPSIASVAADGTVTALQLGEARITARATDGSGVTATCTVTVIPTIATGITLATDGSTTLRATETVQLTATVMPETTTDKTVTWKSDKPAIAMVNESGVVTAISVGEAVITATNSAGQTDEITITVIPTPVALIALNRSTAQLKVQEGFRLTADVQPATATDKSVAWTSSNPGVVQVDSDGNVLALNLGNAIITCEALDGSEVTAQCRITVTETSTQSVSIKAEGNTTLKATETVQLTATVLPVTATNKTVSWQSGNTGIAEVDGSGLVTAISVGTATITATNSGGQTASVTITVIPTPVEAIKLSKTTATLKATESVQLIATVMPETATDKAIEWSSSNEDVATVTQGGLITAAAVGKTTITVKATDGSGVTATCAVEVIATEVSGISITANGQTTLKASETVQLTASVLPETATDKTVTWTASAPQIANVNENGLVTAYAVGQSVIRATSSSGLTAEITITVVPTQVTSIIVNRQSVTMRVSDETHLAATILPSTATDKTVTWKSADPEIATVDTDGNVKAIKEGQTAITCVANDGSGVNATCIVNVVDTEVVTITLTADGPTSLKVSETVQLRATILPETSTDKSLTWQSADENIVTVDENGLVTAVSEGYAAITATTSNGLKDHIIITVVETEVAAITLNESSIVLMANESFSLIPEIQPLTATNKQLKWASVFSSVATVSSDGVVTAVSVGETFITPSATDESGVSASCKVTVIPTPAESIAITVMGETTLEVNQSVQLMAEVLPANATDKSVVWSSSNPSVATVTETGLVTAVSAGEAVVTATNSAGQYDRVTINVISKEPDNPVIPEVKAETPTQLLRKGDGTSHTFVAMMALSDTQLEAMGYNYVFGYTASDLSVSHVIDNTPYRYAHTTEEIYTGAGNDFWVFAYYIEDDGTIRVSSRRHLDGSVDDDFEPTDYLGFLNGESKERIIGIYTVDGISLGTDISRLRSGIYIIKTTAASYKILK